MIEWHPGYDEAVLAALGDWDGPDGCGWQLHPGDVGWFARFGPERLARDLVWWSVDGAVAAVAMVDGSVRTAIAPAYAMDATVAVSVLAFAMERNAAAVDPPPGPSVLRRLLTEEGYEASGEPWLHLYRPLVSLDEVGSEVRAVTSEVVAADRVAVQRAAFARSTYTLERWAELCRGPAYDGERDLVLYADGGPAAAVTVWTAATGRCGLLEPLGVDPEFRGRGLGRAAVAAGCRALATAGASGAAVWTPAANTAAAALYRSCGFRVVAVDHAFARG